jgi:Domain of unknown function (DUF4276)
MGEKPYRWSPMTRLLILVEGITEEKFVNVTLAPYLASFGVQCTAIPNTTSRTTAGSKRSGGVITWGKVEKNLQNLFSGNKNDWVTTLLDFYKIPKDTPSYADLSLLKTPQEQVSCLQNGMREQFPYTRKFIPFVTLHEFEALLFSDLDITTSYFPEHPAALEQLAKALSDVAGNPEQINHGKTTHPFARLCTSFPTKLSTAL